MRKSPIGQQLAVLLTLGFVIMQCFLPTQARIPLFEKPLKPVEQLNLSRYAGQWYEVASVPNIFQRKCVRNAITQYTHKGPALYEDHFQCDQGDGSLYVLDGRFKSVDRTTNATLSATFFKFLGHYRFWFGKNYVVTEIGPDYRYAVVMHPNKHWGWVLSRTPALTNTDWSSVIQSIQAQYVNPCKFMTTP